MNTRITCAALFVSLAFSATNEAAKPPFSQLRSWSTPGYTILAHEESSARTVVADLVTIESVLTSLLSPKQTAEHLETIVILLPREELRRYQRPGAARRPNLMADNTAIYLLLPSDLSRARLRSAVFHQGAHRFLRRHFDAQFPLWFDEGFAILAQGAKVDGARAIVGSQHYSFQRNESDRRPGKSTLDTAPVNRAASSVLDEHIGWMPLERLLRAEEITDQLKLESWALLHKGLIAEPAFGTQLFAYVKAINEKQTVEAAVLASFGMSIDELERNIQRYTKRMDFRDATLMFSPPAPLQLTPGAVLSDAETLALLLRAADETRHL